MSCFVTADWIENLETKMFLLFFGFKFLWFVEIADCGICGRTVENFSRWFISSKWKDGSLLVSTLLVEGVLIRDSVVSSSLSLKNKSFSRTLGYILYQSPYGWFVDFRDHGDCWVGRVESPYFSFSQSETLVFNRQTLILLALPIEYPYVYGKCLNILCIVFCFWEQLSSL